MIKILKDPEIYFLIALLGLVIVLPSKNIYVNSILVPIFLMMQIIGVIFIVKKYLNERKSVKQEKQNPTAIRNSDISIWMILLAAFSSLLAVIDSLVLLLFLHKGDMDMFNYFLIATGCIHLVIVIISITAFLKILKEKK